MPGPGHYDQASMIGKGLSFQMQGKSSLMKGNEVPGPGSYEAQIEAVKDRIQAAKIAGGKRDTLGLSSYDLSKPGPG